MFGSSMSQIVKCPICNLSFTHNSDKIIICQGCGSVLEYRQNNKPKIRRPNAETTKFILIRTISLFLYLGATIFLIQTFSNLYTGLMFGGLFLILNPIIFIFSEARALADFFTIELYYSLIIKGYRVNDFQMRERFWLRISQILVVIGVCLIIFAIIFTT